MKNVLMFYDDAIIIDLVRISLEDRGVEVIGFAEAKNLMSKVQEYQPLAVILDLNRALELGNEIVRSLNARNIPTVIFSSNLNGRKNAEEIGFSHFVKKSPFGFEELEEVIDGVIEKENLQLIPNY